VKKISLNPLINQKQLSALIPWCSNRCHATSQTSRSIDKAMPACSEKVSLPDRTRTHLLRECPLLVYTCPALSTNRRQTSKHNYIQFHSEHGCHCQDI